MPQDAMPQAGARYSLEELTARLLAEPLNSHYRLPGSRGGVFKKNPLLRAGNTIEINVPLHDCWHVLIANKIGTEIASQFNMWWMRKQIFHGCDREKVECRKIVPGTKGHRMRWLWRKTSADTMDLSREQRIAWDTLFGFLTPPSVVIPIANRFLIHADTPLELVSHSRA